MVGAAGADAGAAAPPAAEADPACFVSPVEIESKGFFSTPFPKAYGLGMNGLSKDASAGLGSLGTGVAGIEGFGEGCPCSLVLISSMTGPILAADAAESPPGYAADAAGPDCGGVAGDGAASVVVLTDAAEEAGLALME